MRLGRKKTPRRFSLCRCFRYLFQLTNLTSSSSCETKLIHNKMSNLFSPHSLERSPQSLNQPPALEQNQPPALVQTPHPTLEQTPHPALDQNLATALAQDSSTQNEELSARLQELEASFAELEYTVEQLNTALQDQTLKNLELEKKLQLLAELVRNVNTGAQIAKESEETPPPHY